MYDLDVKKLNEQFHENSITCVEIDVDEMDITFY